MKKIGRKRRGKRKGKRRKGRKGRERRVKGKRGKGGKGKKRKGKKSKRKKRKGRDRIIPTPVLFLSLFFLPFSPSLSLVRILVHTCRLIASFCEF